MYESPITVDYGEIKTELIRKAESLIISCVENVGVDVNKDELIKALSYDRDQYDKGYADAKAEIVHCKDCIYWKHYGVTKRYCDMFDWMSKAEDFCSLGERETNG